MRVSGFFLFPVYIQCGKRYKTTRCEECQRKETQRIKREWKRKYDRAKKVERTNQIKFYKKVNIHKGFWLIVIFL